MKHLSPIETIRVPEPKHDPFSLESLVAWLERQPEDGAYCFGDCLKCMLAQYFTALGFDDVNLSDVRMYHKGGSVPLPAMFNAIALDAFGVFNRPGDFRHTFGAALTRARAALASQKGNANG